MKADVCLAGDASASSSKQTPDADNVGDWDDVDLFLPTRDKAGTTLQSHAIIHWDVPASDAKLRQRWHLTILEYVVFRGHGHAQ